MDPYQLAREFTEHTHHSIFLTGKAGSGKTTLLREIISATAKSYVILAPTGIAAINVGGVTMHSFFTLPTRVFVPTHEEVDYNLCYNIRDLHHHTRYRKEKIELIRNLDMIIIDEISMCRADMMDAINNVLKSIRRSTLPFGGVQLLMVGDLYQLPPVAKEPEWNILRNFYKSPFFFDAQVFAGNLPLQIELDKIYRQSDEKYIGVLNNIRNNEATEEDYAVLNSRYRNDSAIPDDYIVLTTHNRKADDINNRKLEELPGNLKSFTARISGDFQEWSYPCDETLRLKPGARVMFIKNDTTPEKRYFNGKLGVVKMMGPDTVTIECGRETIELERETWRNIRYSFNKENETIEENELGSYSQFPLRLAWAITVHKSQGLTFEKAVIDAGASFASGQVYVALSRCTSLGGMILSSPLRGSQVMIDPGVLRFLRESVHNDVPGLLENEKTAYIATYLKKIFDFRSVHNRMEEVIERLEKKPSEKKIEVITKIMEWINRNNSFIDTASRFHLQIDNISRTASPAELPDLLKERTAKAIAWFAGECYRPLVDEIDDYYRELYKQKKTKKISGEILMISHLIEKKIEQMYGIRIRNEEVYTGPKKVREQVEEKEVSRLAKKNTRDITLEIYLQCKSIPETARARDMAVTTIEGHLAQAIAEKKLEITDIMDAAKSGEIVAAIGADANIKLGELMSKTKGKFTFGELRMAVSFIKAKADQ